MNDISKLEARITALEDIEAIKKLKARYFFSCDQKDIDAVTDCFAEGDVEIKYGRIGDFSRREDLVAVFKELACHPHIIEMHHAQNPQIDLLSDTTARAIWGLYYYMINARDNSATQLGGYYKDEYF